jgi:hypothetical protein
LPYTLFMTNPYHIIVCTRVKWHSGYLISSMGLMMSLVHTLLYPRITLYDNISYKHIVCWCFLMTSVPWFGCLVYITTLDNFWFYSFWFCMQYNRPKTPYFRSSIWMSLLSRSIIPWDKKYSWKWLYVIMMKYELGFVKHVVTLQTTTSTKTTKKYVSMMTLLPL